MLERNSDDEKGAYTSHRFQAEIFATSAIPLQHRLEEHRRVRPVCLFLSLRDRSELLKSRGLVVFCTY
jgi:hypothetical protein